MPNSRCRKLPIAALAAVMLASCALLGPREPIQVSVVDVESLPGEGLEMRMAVKLRIQNPNDAPIDFDGVSLSLDLRGTRFASGVSSERGTVPRYGEAVIIVPVSIPALAAIGQTLDIAANDRASLDYTLRGRLSGAGSGGARFESTGEITLPRGVAAP